jgi:hypothetical protein
MCTLKDKFVGQRIKINVIGIVSSNFVRFGIKKKQFATVVFRINVSKVYVEDDEKHHNNGYAHGCSGDVYPGELDGVYYGDEMLDEDVTIEPTEDIEGDANFTEPTTGKVEDGDVNSTEPTEPEQEATEAA